MAERGAGGSGMLQERAYEYVKKKILADEMEAGVYYSETKLATELGISRTPLHQALHRLSQDGYITISPSRGFMLRQLTRVDMRETIEMRCAIEGFCTYLLGQQSEVHRRHFFLDAADMLSAMRAAMEKRDIPGFAALDHKFHVALVKSANNREFSRMFQRLLYLIHLTTKSSLEVPGRMEETVQEHEAYIDFLKQEKITEAYHAMMQHLLKPIEILSKEFPAEDEMPW